MNQQEMNIALCALRGWEYIGGLWRLPSMIVGQGQYRVATINELPDHFNGEAALHHCHEAEKMLGEPLCYEYAERIMRLQVTGRTAYAALHATAPQRAEALCRTLWPEKFAT